MILLAPEGKRRSRKSIECLDDIKKRFLPLKKGSFHLSKKNLLPILPIYMVGTGRVWRVG